MPEVFISYSRRDLDFGRSLHDALVERQRDVWMDLSDIPAGTKFQLEIFSGIESSDNFVFVISPDSALSAMCRAEVDHALAHGKRLLAVVCRPAGYDQVPPAVAEIEWVDFATLGFDAGLATLIEAIDTDFEWVHRHTRLLVRAREWATNDRDEGFLLHGVELKQAVRWLERAAVLKTRHTTALHQEYIAASEAREAGELQRQIELREKAERAQREAVARERVAFSTLSLTDDVERAILLAMHAIDVTRAADGAMTPEAADALHRALLQSPLRGTLRGDGAGVQWFAVSRDGRRAVSGSDSHAVRFWDVTAGREIGVAGDSLITVRGVAINRDGTRAASAALDRLTVWSVADASELFRKAIPGLGALAITGDGDIVYAASGSVVSVWPVGEERALALTGHTSSIEDIVLDENDSLLVSASEDMTLKVWDLQSFAERHTLRGHTDRVDRVALSRDGRRAVSSSGDRTLRIWDLDTGESVATFTLESDQAIAVALNADGSLAISGGMDGSIRVWDVARAREQHTLRSNGAAVWSLAWTDNERLIISADDDGLSMWDPYGSSELHTLRGHTKAVLGVATTPDRRRIISASADHSLRIWDLELGRELHALSGHAEGVAAIAVSGDGRIAASVSTDRTLRIWDLAMLQERRVIEGLAEFQDSVVLSRDGVFAASGDSSFTLWNLETGDTVRVFSGHARRVVALALSADASRIVSTARDDTMKVWDVESGREVRSIESNGGVIHKVALTADGRRAMTVCDYGSISAWDLDTGVVLWTTQAQRREMFSVALSPDGALVAAGGTDGIVRVLNAADGSQRLTLSGHSESVIDLAWTLDGTRLVSASVDGTLQIYAIDIGLLLSLARTRVTRNLTADECKRYLHRDDVPPVP